MCFIYVSFVYSQLLAGVWECKIRLFFIAFYYIWKLIDVIVMQNLKLYTIYTYKLNIFVFLPIPCLELQRNYKFQAVHANKSGVVEKILSVIGFHHFLSIILWYVSTNIVLHEQI